jgi:hypothetical protein
MACMGDCNECPNGCGIPVTGKNKSTKGGKNEKIN